MKENTLIQMQRDIELLKGVNARAIQQLDYQQQVIGGIMASLELMPGYQEALQKVVESQVKKAEEAKEQTENAEGFDDTL